MNEDIIHNQDVKLTFKQRMFIDEYLKTGNATKSAINAGYSERTAAAIGYELLQKNYIKSALSRNVLSGAGSKDNLDYFRECLLKNRTSKLNKVSAGYVYFLEEENGRVKIGKADNYEKRINSISTSCPYDIKLIGLVESEDCHSLERRFHRKYNAYRIRGEWFDIPESEKKLIANRYNPDSLSGESSSPMTLFNIEEFTE